MPERTDSRGSNIRDTSRRRFLKTSAAAAAAVSLGAPVVRTRGARNNPNANTFHLKYAPHFGMFKHHAGDDPIDQLQFMADEGFTAMEDNGMMGRPIEVQEKVAAEMSRLNMTMGVFVAYAEFQKATLVTDDPEVREMIVQRMHEAVEVAKRVNAKWCTVVPGTYHQGMEWDYQTANVVENLKWASGVLEPAGVIMVLESLNWYADHPGLFLHKIPQAYQICQAVGSPSCKILDDLYHMQISEGNLIPNMDTAWEEIAYFQVGDNPGRKEPGTGEINYNNVFEHIHKKGFTGVIGMEHGNSQPGKAGERAVINAYREADDFSKSGLI